MKTVRTDGPKWISAPSFRSRETDAGTLAPSTNRPFIDPVSCTNHLPALCTRQVGVRLRDGRVRNDEVIVLGASDEEHPREGILGRLAERGRRARRSRPSVGTRWGSASHRRAEHPGSMHAREASESSESSRSGTTKKGQGFSVTNASFVLVAAAAAKSQASAIGAPSSSSIPPRDAAA